MAHRQIFMALSLIVVASPIAASKPQTYRMGPAPAGTPETRYCMRIEAITGSRLEEVKCWTRAEWAEQGVDVDQDWPTEGVSTIG